MSCRFTISYAPLKPAFLALGDPESFRRGEWDRLAEVPVAAQRKESRL